jgi:hypothetical protein
MKIRQLLVDIRILDSRQLKAKLLLEMLPHQKSLPHSSPAIQCQKLRLLARQKTIKLLPFPRPPDDVRFTQSGQIYQKTIDLASLNFMRLPFLLRFVLHTSFPSVKIPAKMPSCKLFTLDFDFDFTILHPFFLLLFKYLTSISSNLKC